MESRAGLAAASDAAYGASREEYRLAVIGRRLPARSIKDNSRKRAPALNVGSFCPGCSSYLHGYLNAMRVNKDFAGFTDPARQPQISLGRGRIATRVIVHHHEAVRRMVDRPSAEAGALRMLELLKTKPKRKIKL